MSDRRRYPPRDDWDDDLDLAGFDRPSPASRSEPRSRGQRQPRQTEAYDSYSPQDDPLSERRSSRPRASQPRQPADDRYGPPVDPYVDPVERTPRSRGPYEDDPYGSRRVERDARYPADSYDQPRRRSPEPGSRTSRRQYPGQAPYDDPYVEDPYGDAPYAEAAYGDADYASPEVAAPPSRRRPSRSREPRQRTSVAVPRPAINDSAIIAIIAASLLSIVFMIASIAAGAGDLPNWFPIHLDASGNVDRWGTQSVLWRIPFGAFMAMIMSLVIAAFLWKRDRFAARFAITGTAVVQVLAWVALIDFIW